MDPKLYEGFQLRMAHRTLLPMISPGTSVLDIGSGSGALTSFLVQKAKCTVTAVDLTPELIANAAPYTSKTVTGSIEDASTWEQIDGTFDYIVFADVLEHLANPGTALQRCKAFLTDGGSVIASIPNVAYYRVRQDLLLGRFDYGPFGILDKTHLRFFTAKTVRSLFDESGYEVTEFLRVFTSPKNRMLGRAFPNAFTYEFILKSSIINDLSAGESRT